MSMAPGGPAYTFRGVCTSCGHKHKPSKRWHRTVLCDYNIGWRVIQRPHSYRIQQLRQNPGYPNRKSWIDVQKIACTPSKAPNRFEVEQERDAAVAAMWRRYREWQQENDPVAFPPKEKIPRGRSFGGDWVDWLCAAVLAWGAISIVGALCFTFLALYVKIAAVFK